MQKFTKCEIEIPIVIHCALTYIYATVVCKVLFVT